MRTVFLSSLFTALILKQPILIINFLLSNFMTKKLIDTIQGKSHNSPPFWFMRQAGRYLPEYREVRKTVSNFLELCYTPKLATEVTLQPLRRFPLDAAILFSDILVVPDAMGLNVRFEENVGPIVEGFHDSHKKIIQNINSENFLQELNPVFETVEMIKSSISKETTFIGFSGAPWTLLCYMIEGRGSKNFYYARNWAYQNKALFDDILEVLEEYVSLYLIQQIKCGVDCIQIFDSWASQVPYDDFDYFCLKPVQRIVRKVRKKYPDIPIIAFPKGANLHLEKYVNETNINVLGIDSTISIGQAYDRINNNCILQGNLDPVYALSGGKALEEKVLKILETMKNKPFIFNFGHGVDKNTPVENISKISKLLNDYA